MNLRDLKYLVAVADNLHFSKAAELCHVSQPTLSMQLKKLEETLGVQLLERSNKQVMLTPIGKDITERARAVLQECDQIIRSAKASHDPFAGDIRLGIFPTLAPYLLPRIIAPLKKKFPRLNFLLVEEKTAEIIARLKSGDLDAGFLALPLTETGLETITLFDEPFFLAVPAQHSLAKNSEVSSKQLAHETMLLLDEGHCLRAQALDVCQAIGMGEAQNFRGTSLETLRYMVAGGNAITLMPALAVRDSDSAIRYLPFKHPAPSRRIGLCFRAAASNRQRYDALAETIQTIIAKDPVLK